MGSNHRKQDELSRDIMPEIEAGMDHPKEECGIFGVFGPLEDVARLTFFGLFALQHRGQESAGIAVSDGTVVRMHKEMGLVSQVFDEHILSELPGYIAIGHTRYSTTGSSMLRNAQPITCSSQVGDIAVAHNGNLVNAQQVRRELEDEGIVFDTTNDSEVIARLIATHPGNIIEAVRAMMRRVQGAYSLAILTPTQLIGVRDPYGVRPLCLATLNGYHVIASETCALGPVGAVFDREIEPGEIAVIDENGANTYIGVPKEREALCMFEYIYFARPDSRMHGQLLHQTRRRMGRKLAEEHPAPSADLVIPVPDSGFPAALGFAEISGIPFGEGMVKSRYIHRTFIQPDQRMRELGVRMKLSALKEVLEGKSIVIVDDSIVRATTTRQLVKLLKDAGATEVHVRITAPPIQYPCFYGIDMATQRELIAAQCTVEEIRNHIGATSLGYLSVDGLIEAVNEPKSRFCLACFTGEYPIRVPDDVKLTKTLLEMAEMK